MRPGGAADPGGRCYSRSVGSCRLALTVALATAACVSGARPAPVRLYEPTAQPLRPEEVSTLSGYVRFVDGIDVSSRGKRFELLPGCHLVGTPSSWGSQSPGGSSVVTARTGQWLFALPMKAGHFYQIEVIVGQMTGPTGSLTIKGSETDSTGTRTAEFERVENPEDIVACRNAAAASTETASSAGQP